MFLRTMFSNIRWAGIFAFITLVSCNKNAFEQLQMSNDLELKYNKALEFYDKKDYEKAQYLFEALMGDGVRLQEKSERIYYYYAYTHYYLKNYNFASYYFRQFYNTFPNSMFAEEALFMCAQAYYQLSPNYRLTQEDTYKAIENFQLFANANPESDRIAICNEKIDELRAKLEVKDLENAKGYYKRKQYQAAAHCFKNLLGDFPETKNAEYIRYMIAKSLYKFATESIIDKQIERYEEAIRYCQFFKKRHAESTYSKEVDLINETCIQKIKKLKNIS